MPVAAASGFSPLTPLGDGGRSTLGDGGGDTDDGVRWAPRRCDVCEVMTERV